MSEWKLTGEQLGSVYVAFWRLIDMTVHRYGSHPTGQLYVVLTIMMLNRVDFHPTVGELAEIVRLPKSTVSRYVSAEMNAGFLEEVIDPDDRRRRRLHLTPLGKEEGHWHREQIRQITEMSSKAFNKSDFAVKGKVYFDEFVAASRAWDDQSS